MEVTNLEWINDGSGITIVEPRVTGITTSDVSKPSIKSDVIHPTLPSYAIHGLITPTEDKTDILSIVMEYRKDSKESKVIFTFDESSIRTVSLALILPYTGCNLLSFFNNKMKDISEAEKVQTADGYPKGANVPNSIYQRLFNLFLIDLSMYLLTMTIFVQKQDLLSEPLPFAMPFSQLDMTIFYRNSLDYMNKAAVMLRGIHVDYDLFFMSIINFTNRWELLFEEGPVIQDFRMQADIMRFMNRQAILEVKQMRENVTRDLNTHVKMGQVDTLLIKVKNLEDKFMILDSGLSLLSIKVDSNTAALEDNARRLTDIEAKVNEVKIEKFGVVNGYPSPPGTPVVLNDPQTIKVVASQENNNGVGRKVGIMKAVSKYNIVT